MGFLHIIVFEEGPILQSGVDTKLPVRQNIQIENPLKFRKRRCLGCGKAVEEEDAEDAGEADEQTSDPNGVWRDVIVEGTANDRGESAREPPAQPVDRHIAAA